MGGFSYFNSSTYRRIVRLNTDGSVDATFIPLGNNLSFIYDVELYADGKMLVAGSFVEYNGNSRINIARLNSDGSLDATFTPGAQEGEYSSIFGVAIQSDGKILVTQSISFTAAPGQSTVYRLNADGTPDTTFSSGTGIDASGHCFAILPDGKILFGGSFSVYDGVARRGIVRLNADGTLDTTFQGTGLGTVNPRVSEILIQPNGGIIISGVFDSYNSTARKNIARLNFDGAVDTAFNPGLGADAEVTDLGILPDGKLLITGLFNSYDTTPRPKIARLNIVSTCPSGNITLSNQTEVDDFAASYPTCTTIAGNLTITPDLTSDYITNLDALSNITTVTGNLVIAGNVSLISLEGLSNLTKVGQILEFDNNALTTLAGLESLSSVGSIFITNMYYLQSLTTIPVTTLTDLHVQNTTLTSLAGLESLTSARTVWLVENEEMTSLEGLNNLSEVRIMHVGATAITDVEPLSNLTTIKAGSGLADIGFDFNLQLTTIDGLRNLNTTGMTRLILGNNPLLSHCNTPNICSYLANGGDHILYGNAAECDSVETIVAACTPSDLTSQILPTQCASTLVNINSLIGAVSVAGANGYRFEVTNMTTNAVQTLDRGVPNFKLTQLGVYDYSTTYSIRVMLRVNNIWTNTYGPACLVSSPDVTIPGGPAQVNPSQCGQNLPSLNTLIATTSLAGVAQYRFRITDLTDPDGPNQVQTIERPLHWFSLKMLTRYNYGTTYQVEVAVRTTTSATFGGYGSACLVNSPPVPQVQQCDQVISSATFNIRTTSLDAVTQYRFLITDFSTLATTTIDRPLHWFNFGMIPGYQPGGSYGVQVALMTSGQWSPLTDGCEIVAPGGARENIKQSDVAFDAVAYPNPFASAFSLGVSTSAEADVNLKVYDMTGRILHNRTVSVADMQNLQIGENFPAGVYNLIVTQGDQAKTIRVIKR